MSRVKRGKNERETFPLIELDPDFLPRAITCTWNQFGRFIGDTATCNSVLRNRRGDFLLFLLATRGSLRFPRKQRAKSDVGRKDTVVIVRSCSGGKLRNKRAFSNHTTITTTPRARFSLSNFPRVPGTSSSRFSRALDVPRRLRGAEFPFVDLRSHCRLTLDRSSREKGGRNP